MMVICLKNFTCSCTTRTYLSYIEKYVCSTIILTFNSDIELFLLLINHTPNNTLCILIMIAHVSLVTANNSHVLMLNIKKHVILPVVKKSIDYMLFATISHEGTFQTYIIYYHRVNKIVLYNHTPVNNNTLYLT